ncbi:MAG: hypothetical protein JXR56_07070, partial [Candidatus Cloacimonetes bacterium]|nr:hypothetical protein [Candidatus Cloacimonadota bacterium]
DTLFTMLDLHGFHHTGVAGWVNDDTFIPFTPGSTGQNVWPGTLDYPFYNPLWPELLPYRERGTIYLFGSVAQRRRGYVHRSDSANANRTGVWDFWDETMTGIPKYGALVGAQQLPHSPSATGTQGEGYSKDYRFDKRFEIYQPPFYPSVHVERGLSPYDPKSFRFKKPPTVF